MCVIMAIEGTEPTKEMLERAWDSNPHGGGIAWREGGYVHWQKGIMDKEEMLAAIEAKRGVPRVVHFRVASVGGVKPQLTHPFHLDAQASLALSGKTKAGVLFHNGHVSDWQNMAKEAVLRTGLKIPLGSWSDTRVLAWLTHKYGNIMEFLPEQKGIIMTPERNFIYTGRDGWEKVNGVWCSNDYFFTKHGLTRGGSNHNAGFFGGTMCRNGSCTKPRVAGKEICASCEAKATPKSDDKEGEPSKVAVPFKTANGFITETDATNLWRGKLISRSLLKKIKKDWKQIQSGGKKGERAEKSLKVHTETVIRTIAHGLIH